MPAVLGFDTSNYTTSAALYDPYAPVMLSKRRILPVGQGKRGVAQNEAVFEHIKTLPELIGQLTSEYGEAYSAVAVSSRPRDVAGSYMPCFMVGRLAAQAAAMQGKIPVYEFSHQAGHVAAALYSAKRLALVKQKFLAFQLSGGTTEGLVCTPDPSLIIKCEQAVTSLDLKAGQAVDRAGVMLGLSFPAGAQLDRLCEQSTKEYRVKPSAKGVDVSLSGIENKSRSMLEAGEAPCDIAKFVLQSIAAALLHMIDSLCAQHGSIPLVFAGGVMSNTLLRRVISEKYPQAIFAQSGLSSDNAVGTAVLGALRHGMIKP